MDFGASSAARIVPHFRDRLSQGISTIKDRFLTNTTEWSPPSTIFLMPEDVEVADFHHQEVVESSQEIKNASSVAEKNPRIEDLDLLPTNDLFSFVLDNSELDANRSGCFDDLSAQPSDTLTTAFQNPCSLGRLSSECLEDTTIPLDLLDLLDLTVEVTNNSCQSANSYKTSTSVELLMTDNTSSLPSVSLPSSDQSFRVNMVEMEGESESGIYSGDLLMVDDNEGINTDHEFCEEDDEEEERSQCFKKLAIGRRSDMFASTSGYLHNEDLAHGRPGQKLALTREEKRLLTQIGHKIPLIFPLSRADERAIRTVRRKIRNKLSAKASRARRQDYLASLESRVTSCNKENHRLRLKINELEVDKRGLMVSLRQMRSYIARLMSGMPVITRSVNNKGPLLPLTVPSRTRKPNSRSTLNWTSQSSFSKSRSAAAGGTSLLVVTFMILAWATVMPLPDFTSTNQKQGADTVTIGSRVNPSMFNRANLIIGASRTLLASKNNDVVELPSVLPDYEPHISAKWDNLVDEYNNLDMLPRSKLESSLPPLLPTSSLSIEYDSHLPVSYSLEDL